MGNNKRKRSQLTNASLDLDFLDNLQEDLSSNNQAALQIIADELSEKAPKIDKNKSVQMDKIIHAVESLLNHIKQYPRESFNLYGPEGEYDLARCVYALIGNLVDYKLFKSTQPSTHNALLKNLSKLEIFFTADSALRAKGEDEIANFIPESLKPSATKFQDGFSFKTRNNSSLYSVTTHHDAQTPREPGAVNGF